MYGGRIAREKAMHFWFQDFRSGSLDLENKPGDPTPAVRGIVVNNPSQATLELAANC